MDHRFLNMDFIKNSSWVGAKEGIKCFHSWMEHDLFQTKTSTFSTRALILVHFKTVRYIYQSIFSLFSYLKNA